MPTLEQVRQSRALGAQSGVQQSFQPLRDGCICSPHPAPAFLPPTTDSAAAAAFHPRQNNRYPSSQASHPLIPSIIPSLCSPAQPQLSELKAFHCSHSNKASLGCSPGLCRLSKELKLGLLRAATIQLPVPHPQQSPHLPWHHSDPRIGLFGDGSEEIWSGNI